jgi:hypothetical protein
LTALLQQHGFERIEFGEPQDYHAALAPCLRVTAIKPPATPSLATPGLSGRLS